MYPHHNTPDESDDTTGEDHTRGGDDTDGVVIPLPRPAADDDIENLPNIGSDQPVWWYDQQRQRGSDRQFSGYVAPVFGTDGEQLRSDLAAIIRDLLDWANKQSRKESTEDGEAA
ncbi:hypothetical protein [Gandjariella thermophila]|uniref:Uncharacterized protein n=1 Tax=Gandjariella thermophila TaxID=1931992 RepID=A0A4D4JJ25_9PSEU|nr:hypothetical protein [Gandjariella thermophila]GDY33903.1 hypothetical protein GTS_55360 [Gandjariella thermophila]